MTRVVKKTVSKPPAPRLRTTKPTCPTHGVAMRLNVVDNLWRCDMELCKVIGRPKNLHDTGDTIIGRGEISLRIMRHDTGEVDKIVLMAKNNVLLDITDQVDFPALMNAIKDKASGIAEHYTIPFTTLNIWQGHA